MTTKLTCDFCGKGLVDWTRFRIEIKRGDENPVLNLNSCRGCVRSAMDEVMDKHMLGPLMTDQELEADAHDDLGIKDRSPFVYTEDVSDDTGHGWRSKPHVIRRHHGVSKAYPGDTPIEEREGADKYTYRYADCSYVWIGYRSDWEKCKTHIADDCLRTYDVRKTHPEFQGCDDMEGHFEFTLGPKAMKAHLAELGIPNTADLERPS